VEFKRKTNKKDMKAIYQPKGKAAEYSKWACNFYVGCSNDCSYCYLKKGRGKEVLGGNIPTLKKCFKDEDHALKVFQKELKDNLPELQKNGLFFSFSTDPMLPKTRIVTWSSFIECYYENIPIKILTKNADFINDENISVFDLTDEAKKFIAFGFTLTGHDELEHNASTNAERIEAMKKLHEAGFRTFASIEPIIDFESSKNMIELSIKYCDLYMIGLESGKKYDIVEAQSFVEHISELQEFNNAKIYLKNSLQKLTRYTNEELPDNFVSSGYNLFKNKI